MPPGPRAAAPVHRCGRSSARPEPPGRGCRPSSPAPRPGGAQEGPEAFRVSPGPWSPVPSSPPLVGITPPSLRVANSVAAPRAPGQRTPSRGPGSCHIGTETGLQRQDTRGCDRQARNTCRDAAFTFQLDQLLFRNPAGLSLNQVTGALHNAHLLFRNSQLHNFGMHVQLSLKNEAYTAIQDQNQTCANN